MDNEEYKRKALEPIVNYIESVMDSYSKEELEAIIKKALPERESEDERIRKRLVEYFNGFYDRFSSRNNVNVHWEGLEVKAVIAYLERQKEQQPAKWSEEDKTMLERCISKMAYVIPVPGKHGLGDMSFEKHTDEELVIWLKSLRPQSKQEWNEEDNKMLNSIIELLSFNVESNMSAFIPDKSLDGYKKQLEWIRNLQHKRMWKPSEEQIEALRNSTALNEEQGAHLYSLLFDLKKLL